MNEPELQAKPQVRIEFLLNNLQGVDFGYYFDRFEFKGMMNGGYVIRAKLLDVNFNMMNNLIKDGYFRETRKKAIPIRFQILAGSKGEYPKSATKSQIAILLELNVDTKSGDAAFLEFVAIDPASWYLNTGDASGKVYKGRVDQVIRQVVNEYAPPINLDIGKTNDNVENKWWMMRQDPKTFISSLIEWSSSITQRKTQWLIECDGYDLTIKEQGALQSRQRAFYRYLFDSKISTIKNINIRAKNALSIVQTKLITAGLSATSGRYLDKITDSSEKNVFVSDKNTDNKQIARTGDGQTFSKPADGGPTQLGWSQVMAIPEIYSSGDTGLPYENYIDGRPRAIWLNMVNSLLRAKLTVMGHGEWSECRGLGVDTIFVKWTSGKVQDEDTGSKFWWPTGNWLVYGFNHVVTRKAWNTELYCARYDYDSNARVVGGGSSN